MFADFNIVLLQYKYMFYLSNNILKTKQVVCHPYLYPRQIGNNRILFQIRNKKKQFAYFSIVLFQMYVDLRNTIFEINNLCAILCFKSEMKTFAYFNIVILSYFNVF